MNTELKIWLALAGVTVSFVIVLPALNILLCREWVKKDLLKRCCTPLHIRWNPFDFNSPSRPPFRVIYTDPAGQKHRAYCWVSDVVYRQVNWVKDEIMVIDV